MKSFDALVWDPQGNGPVRHQFEIGTNPGQYPNEDEAQKARDEFLDGLAHGQVYETQTVQDGEPVEEIATANDVPADAPADAAFTTQSPGYPAPPSQPLFPQQ